MRSCLLCAVVILGCTKIHAATTLLSDSRYSVDASVNFSVTNEGASNFLFTWIDTNGTFSNVADPTLVLTAGQTYTFERASSFHPFIIMDSSYAFIAGSDGEYVRTSSSAVAMSDATLTPVADFTSDPGGGDPITWTPGVSDVGTYWYTCEVTGHGGMTGRIDVIPEPSTCLLGFIGLASLLRRRR